MESLDIESFDIESLAIESFAIESWAIASLAWQTPWSRSMRVLLRVLRDKQFHMDLFSSNSSRPSRGESKYLTPQCKVHACSQEPPNQL